jgi:hypothetical protein
VFALRTADVAQIGLQHAAYPNLPSKCVDTRFFEMPAFISYFSGCQTQILTDRFTTFATCLSSLAVESRPERQLFSFAVRPSLNRLCHSLVCVRLLDSLLNAYFYISNISKNIFPNLKQNLTSCSWKPDIFKQQKIRRTHQTLVYSITHSTKAKQDRTILMVSRDWRRLPLGCATCQALLWVLVGALS